GRRVAGEEVDDARRQPRLLQDLHRVVAGQDRAGGGLPHDRVAHERGRSRQVRADGREVERRDRVDEAFQRAELQLVPDAGGGGRLALVPLPCVRGGVGAAGGV